MAKETIYTLPPNGDEDQGKKYIAAAWVLVMSALISTIVRVLVRSRLTRNMGADDWWMIVTMICNLVGLGFVTKEVVDGLGRHMYYISAGNKESFGVIGWLDWMQTFITICFCKISICLFLLRIKNTRKNYYYMYALIAANVIVTIVIVACFIAICDPPNGYWIVGHGKCHNRVYEMALVIAQGIFSALSDIILATTPLLLLKNLQISKRTKIALCILMGAGYITAAASIVRTALSGAVLEIDVTWAMVPNAAWRATEVNLGVICANAPILRPLYLWYRGRLQRKGNNSSYVATKGSEGKGKSHVRIWPRSGHSVSEEEGNLPKGSQDWKKGRMTKDIQMRVRSWGCQLKDT